MKLRVWPAFFCLMALSFSSGPASAERLPKEALFAASCASDDPEASQTCQLFIVGFSTAMLALVQVNSPPCMIDDFDALNGNLQAYKLAIINASAPFFGRPDKAAMRIAVSSAMLDTALRSVSAGCADHLVADPAWKGLGK